MKTKYYLLFLIVVIMSAGGRTMFQIAFNGMAKEHDGAPDRETTGLMLLAIWFILMMVTSILLLNYKNIRYRTFLIALLSVGIFAPTIYMFLTQK